MAFVSNRLQHCGREGTSKVGKHFVIFGHFRERNGPALTPARSDTQHALCVIP